MQKLLLVSLILFIGSCSLNSVIENIDSPNFKDGIFHNLDPNKNRKRGFLRFLSMRLKTDWSDWPDWVSTDEVVNLKSREFSEKIKVSWINHSTFLIQTQSLNIITDPIFSERASPVSFAGPKRVHKPSISLTNLPKIDIVIISHITMIIWISILLIPLSKETTQKFIWVLALKKDLKTSLMLLS